MSEAIEFPGNCGMVTLVGLTQSPEAVLSQFYSGVNYDFDFEENGVNGPAIVAFSDAVVYKNGSRLATYITRHKLGKVITTPAAVNPKTDRKIQAWYWVVNQKAWTKWLKKQNLLEDEDE